MRNVRLALVISAMLGGCSQELPPPTSIEQMSKTSYEPQGYVLVFSSLPDDVKVQHVGADFVLNKGQKYFDVTLNSGQKTPERVALDEGYEHLLVRVARAEGDGDGVVIYRLK